MSALVGISLWVALATVVPGLVTMAVLWACLVVAGVQLAVPGSDWIVAGVAVTVMVLTQAVGILLEEALARFHLLGSQTQVIRTPSENAPGGAVTVEIAPYDLYGGLYVFLARLTEDDDSQGHLKRALAQFFLTNNTLVSFGAGIVLCLALLLDSETANTGALALLCGGLVLALAVSYRVAVIRFREMTKSLWAVQTQRPSGSAGGG